MLQSLLTMHIADKSLPTAKHKDLIAIFERANHIASMTSLEDLLDQMLDLIIDVAGATAGTLYLLDEGAGELIFKVVKGSEGSKKLVGMRMRHDQGIVGASVQSRTPIVSEDLHSDPRWYRPDPQSTKSLKNAITFPLLLQGKPIGAVQVFNYVHAELELLQLLGNRMASEVDKVLLLEKAKRTNLRLHSLVDILGQIGTTLDRDEILQTITNQAAELVEAEGSSIFLVNPAEDEIIQVSNPHREETDDKRSALLSAVNADRRAAQGFQAHSTVMVPLHARPIKVGKERSPRENRLIGNLMAINKRLGEFDDEDKQLLGILASQVSTVLQISELYSDANDLFLDFIKSLAAAIDAKDPYTRGHSQRVSDLSVAIAHKLGLTSDMINDLRIGSLLHDVGKIGISDAIMLKPTELDRLELDEMKKHPAIGYRIMSQVRYLNKSLPAISEHHERLDGSGYPFGLNGDQITLIGRIVAVADVFDAMTTDRPYRSALDETQVLDYLNHNMGKLFDRDCVKALEAAF